MSDLELTKLCAEAMGIKHGVDICLGPQLREGEGFYGMVYQPLYDDAQAMQLVKKFELTVLRDEERWHVDRRYGAPFDGSGAAHADDLNRAIVECVAKMRAAE